MNYRRWLYSAGMCMLPSLAFAGAWTQPQGETLMIITDAYYAANRFWNNNGKSQSQNTYHKLEFNPYFEYGLRDDITLGTNLSLQYLYQRPARSGSYYSYGIGDSEWFVRKRIWQQGGWVASLEPMVKLPSPAQRSLQPRLGSTHPDAGMGGNVGYGFKAFGQNHFADIDTQYRYRFGPSHNQVRISGSLGINLTPKWMVLPQTFITRRTKTSAVTGFTQSPSDDYNLTRAQLSAVYTLNEKVSFQLGGFADVAGKNAGVGRGVILALWAHL